MPIPQTIPGGGNVSVAARCSIAERWGLELELVDRLVRMAGMLPFGIEIISGARTRAHQEQLQRDGRPTAPFHLSTHAAEDVHGCPRDATGADLRPQVSFNFTPAVRAQFGSAAVHAGLRWGGGGSVDPATGIPNDWQHVDLGPRTRP